MVFRGIQLLRISSAYEVLLPKFSVPVVARSRSLAHVACLVTLIYKNERFGGCKKLSYGYIFTNTRLNRSHDPRCNQPSTPQPHLPRAGGGIGSQARARPLATRSCDEPHATVTLERQLPLAPGLTTLGTETSIEPTAQMYGFEKLYLLESSRLAWTISKLLHYKYTLYQKGALITLICTRVYTASKGSEAKVGRSPLAKAPVTSARLGELSRAHAQAPARAAGAIEARGARVARERGSSAGQVGTHRTLSATYVYFLNVHRNALGMQEDIIFPPAEDFETSEVPEVFSILTELQARHVKDAVKKILQRRHGECGSCRSLSHELRSSCFSCAPKARDYACGGRPSRLMDNFHSPFRSSSSSPTDLATREYDGGHGGVPVERQAPGGVCDCGGDDDGEKTATMKTTLTLALKMTSRERRWRHVFGDDGGEWVGVRVGDSGGGHGGRGGDRASSETARRTTSIWPPSALAPELGFSHAAAASSTGAQGQRVRVGACACVCVRVRLLIPSRLIYGGLP
ncbi:Protein of unknown function [Gryllus bimaculatus]|nr:Protein of unknown function [Gryllus bimaculatus]